MRSDAALAAVILTLKPPSPPHNSNSFVSIFTQLATLVTEFIHPSEDPRVIAGQGTVSKEFIEQCGEVRRE